MVYDAINAIYEILFMKFSMQYISLRENFYAHDVLFLGEWSWIVHKQQKNILINILTNTLANISNILINILTNTLADISNTLINNLTNTWANISNFIINILTDTLANISNILINILRKKHVGIYIKYSN